MIIISYDGRAVYNLFGCTGCCTDICAPEYVDKSPTCRLDVEILFTKEFERKPQMAAQLASLFTLEFNSLMEVISLQSVINYPVTQFSFFVN